MVVSAEQLRADLDRLLDRVVETGEPLEVEWKGRILKIVAEPRGFDALEPHPEAVIGEADFLVHLDWSSDWRPG